MKNFSLVFTSIATAFLLAGCGKNSSPQAQGTNSALDYGNTLVNAKKTADKTIDVSYLNEALQQFNVQEGRYPKTLQELTPNYVAKIPEPPIGYKLNYDAVKGEVKVVAQ
jgi:hypothetical protein